MQHSLTSLFASLPVQPTLDRPVARAATRDRTAVAAPDREQDGGHEFQLPAETRERARGHDRLRSRLDEPRGSSETRRTDNARETAPRRADPPSRSDPPRGADRARNGEPPRRQDPPDGPARTGDREPAGRADARGSAAKEDAAEDAAAPQSDCHEEDAGNVASAISPSQGNETGAATASEPSGSLPAGESEAAVTAEAEAEEQESEGTADTTAAAGQMQAASSATQPPMADSVAASTFCPAAASSPAAQAADQSSGSPATADAVAGIGDKPPSAHDKSLRLGERADRQDAKVQTETGQSPPLDPAALDNGAANAAAKTEPSLSTFEPTAAASPASHAPAAGAPSAQAAATPNPPIRVTTDVPIGAVPIEIGLKSLAGVNHFEIRLDPAELGRIEVRLDIDEDGGVKAHLTVDRVETLALLQRDARSLERAFEQAGLKPTDGSVDLSLRDQSHGQGRHENGGEPRRESGSRVPDSSRDTVEAVRPEPQRWWRGTAGVDVRI